MFWPECETPAVAADFYVDCEESLFWVPGTRLAPEVANEALDIFLLPTVGAPSMFEGVIVNCVAGGPFPCVPIVFNVGDLGGDLTLIIRY